MKKIGIFTGFFLPHLGGVERYTDKLSEQLQKLGYEIVIITSNHDNLEYIEEDKYKIYRLPIYNLLKQRYPLPKNDKEYKKLRKQIEDENFDYIICNTRFYLNTLFGVKLGKKKHIPVLLIEHGSSHFSVNNKMLDYFGGIYEHFLTNLIKKDVNGFYGVSNRCNEWLKHFKINAKGVFYNSIDKTCYKKFCNKKYKQDFKDKIVITYAGRVIREKGVYLLLDAFSKLADKYKNIVLVVAGDGPILDELKEKYKNPRIYFEGKLSYDEIMPLYNVTDIFVHPSMFPEGLPTTILEAGIMKCAIIATDRGGTTEVINNKKFGLIVEENMEDVYRKMKYLLDNPKEIEVFKENIHNRIMNDFVWEETAKIVDKELEKFSYEKED